MYLVQLDWSCTRCNGLPPGDLLSCISRGTVQYCRKVEGHLGEADGGLS
jgi:hypothetical protein